MATVLDVARDGLEGALGFAERKRFAAWRASERPAWLLIDSVDEAKLDGIRLRTALRKVADAIDGLAGRAQILLSSRFTDWEARHNLATFGDMLQIPAEAPERSSRQPDRAASGAETLTGGGPPPCRRRRLGTGSSGSGPR